MSEKVHYMEESLVVGKRGEEKVRDFLLSKPYVESYVDVRNLKEFMDVDIDFCVRFKDGSEHGMEVKTDTHSETGNVFFELKSCEQKNTLGCVYKTGAKWMLYYFEDTGVLYILFMPKLREWLDRNMNSFATKKVKNQRRFFKGESDRYYYSVGKLVPRWLLEQQSFVRVHHLAD